MNETILRTVGYVLTAALRGDCGADDMLCLPVYTVADTTQVLQRDSSGPGDGGIWWPRDGAVELR